MPLEESPIPMEEVESSQPEVTHVPPFISENSVVFEFIIVNALFHKQGRYHLQLSINSNEEHTDYCLLKVKSDVCDYGLSPEVKTDSILADAGVDTNFLNNRWIFILPKGTYGMSLPC